MLVLDLLKKHEGFRAKPYLDTVGKWTVGYGRNLSDKGLTEPEAEYLLRNDILDAEARLARLPYWAGLNDVRRAVLTDMTVNLGIAGLLTFKKMLAHLDAGDFEKASQEGLRSKWASQVGERAQELMKLLREGENPDD